jgi:drug/metabolite transporter (DMT)-like permease
MKAALKTAYLLIILNSVLWGLTNIFVKVVLDNGVNEMQFLFYRMLICVVIIFPFMLKTFGIKKIANSFLNIRNVVVMAFSFGITTYLSFAALSYTTVILFTIVGALRPLIADIMGAIMLKEKIDKEEMIGTAIAFIGTLWVIYLQSFSNGDGFDIVHLQNNIIGVVLALLVSIFWIIANILFKGIKKEDREVVSYNSFVFTIIMAVVMILSSDIKLFAIPSLDTYGWFALAFTAIGGGLIAMMSYQKALETIEVSEANLFYYLQVAVTIPAAVFLLHEKFDLMMLFPLGLVVIGVYLNVRKKFFFNEK